MKRHAKLVVLSREHHDGLLLAVRLQQGEQALERLWSHDPLWQAAEVVRFFETHLTPHFADEENLLFPLAERYFEDAAVVGRLRSEHDEMRHLAGALRTPSGDVARMLKRFGEILEGHIRCEEREFFPACEERIPEQELQQLRITR